VAAECEALAAYLEYYRATLEMKCRGLTPEQARTRSMPLASSPIQLEGLRLATPQPSSRLATQEPLVLGLHTR